MIVLDVNVLIAAHRADHASHSLVQTWLKDVLAGPQDVIVPDLVWVGFLRIVTNPRVFKEPSELDEATGFIEDVIVCSAYRQTPGLPQGIHQLASICLSSNARANLVTDAYIAAVALVYGAAVATFDRDFRRFDGLTIITPTD